MVSFHLEPVVSWLYRTSSLFSINLSTVRYVNTSHAPRHEDSVLANQSLLNQIEIRDAQQGRNNANRNKMSGAQRKALVLRRLIPVVFAMVILGAGLCVHLVVPLPTKPLAPGSAENEFAQFNATTSPSSGLF